MVNPIAERTPLRVFAKIKEKVKRKEKKRRKKKRGKAPKESGSTKYITEATPIQRKIVTIRVGKKFFLSLTSFFLISFLTISF